MLVLTPTGESIEDLLDAWGPLFGLPDYTASTLADVVALLDAVPFNAVMVDVAFLPDAGLLHAVLLKLVSQVCQRGQNFSAFSHAFIVFLI